MTSRTTTTAAGRKKTRCRLNRRAPSQSNSNNNDTKLAVEKKSEGTTNRGKTTKTTATKTTTTTTTLVSAIRANQTRRFEELDCSFLDDDLLLQVEDTTIAEEDDYDDLLYHHRRQSIASSSCSSEEEEYFADSRTKAWKRRVRAAADKLWDNSSLLEEEEGSEHCIFPVEQMKKQWCKRTMSTMKRQISRGDSYENLHRSFSEHVNKCQEQIDSLREFEMDMSSSRELDELLFP